MDPYHQLLVDTYITLVDQLFTDQLLICKLMLCILVRAIGDTLMTTINTFLHTNYGGLCKAYPTPLFPGSDTESLEGLE